MRLFLLYVFLLTGCSDDWARCKVGGCQEEEVPKPNPENQLSNEQIDSLKEMSFYTAKWAPVCTNTKIACSEDEHGEKEAGDSLLWAGLLCLSGNNLQCIAAGRSQNPTTGQIFRNPHGLLDDAEFSRTENSSSRDMLLGFLAYVLRGNYKIQAKKLLSYLRQNDYQLCNDATDNRCDMHWSTHQTIWGTMRFVWEKIGLDPTWEMDYADSVDEQLVSLQSAFAPEGYQLHLVGVEILLYQASGHFSPKLREATEKLVQREPLNPFYEYLAHGATHRAAQLTLSKCSLKEPVKKTQWAWQRTDSEGAWKDSMGHDCLFMEKILLRSPLSLK